MLLEEPVRNPTLGRFHCRRLAELRGAAPRVSIEAAVSAETNAFTQAVQYIPTPDQLDAMFVTSGNHGIVYIDGVKTERHANLLLDGYGGTVFNPGTPPRNLWCQTMLEQWKTNGIFAQIQEKEHLTLAGYSAGGCFALVLAWEMRRLQTTTKIKVFNYGSPRVGGPEFRDSLSTFPIVRWMVDSDPIPLLPLRLQDAPAIAAVYSVIKILAWSNFVHTNGGVSLDSVGATAESVVPPLAAANPITSVVSWMMGVTNAPNNPHALTTYNGRFDLNAQLQAGAPPRPVNIAPGELPTDDRRQDVNRQRVVIAAKIVEAGQAQNGPIVQAPDDAFFKPLRQGKIWYVTFGDRIICAAPIEKRARHICRAGNDFLRSLPKQAVVDPEALVDQFIAFMERASDPTGGFVPQINTSIQ